MTYRLLNEGEEIREGDEIFFWKSGPEWIIVSQSMIGTKHEGVKDCPIRRRDDTKAEALRWLKELNENGLHYERVDEYDAFIVRLESEIGGE